MYKIKQGTELYMMFRKLESAEYLLIIRFYTPIVSELFF